MDHHCPWVGNCVGYTNYKYFVLFLFFTCAYTFYITVCCVPYISDVWNKRTNNPWVFYYFSFSFLVILLVFSDYFPLKVLTFLTFSKFLDPLFLWNPRSGWNCAKIKWLLQWNASYYKATWFITRKNVIFKYGSSFPTF